MTTFTRGQSITFRRNGVTMTGTVEDVGTSVWGVRMADRNYYAVYDRDLVEQTPAQKAGLKIGDVVIVGRGIECPHSFGVGEEAVFKRDDGSDKPLFEQDDHTQFLALSEITIGRDTRTPSQKLGLKEGDEVLMEHAGTRGLSGRIILCHDDGTTIPRFRDERGREHYANLDDVTKAPTRVPVVDTRTPAQKAGLKVGDTVKLLDQEFITYFGSEFTKFKRDDGSEMPRFGEGDKSLWLNLSDVQKVEPGPRAGVKWSEAPIGATHYSLYSSHRCKWHKLDEAGQWFYFDGGRFKPYSETSYAYPDQQVAVPGVAVEVNLLNAVFAEVKALEGQVRGKLTTIEALNGAVARLNTEKQAKLDQIKAGGFKVEGGKLVKTGKPVAEWQDGDRVRCITRDGRGCANIIIGGVYKVKRRNNDVGVIDGDGDLMRGCVESGCFEFVSSTPDLSAVPAREWKAGDVIRNVSDEDRGHYDITVGKEYTLLSDVGLMSSIYFRDNAGDRRGRSASDYVLVRRA